MGGQFLPRDINLSRRALWVGMFFSFGGFPFMTVGRNSQVRSFPAIRLSTGNYCVVGSKSSMPNMTGRPGYPTIEMFGGSSAPYLACTPCVPLFCTSFNRVETEGLLDYQGRAGDHVHCTVEPSPGHIRCRKVYTFRDLPFLAFSWDFRRPGVSDSYFSKV